MKKFINILIVISVYIQASFKQNAMKSFNVFLFICCFAAPVGIFAQAADHPPDSVEVISTFKNMYRYQHYYLSGQPSYEALQWLKTKGIRAIINLRSEKENTEYTIASYNEENVARQLDIPYYVIPVDGIKDYTPEKLQELSNLIDGNDPVFIHCAGIGRVNYFFMAYLIKNKGYSIDEAVCIGKQLTFTFPLENLLDTQISMKAVD
jgi:protein tyrosine phosphatase (PTP) superfamily phosphohydrolase (DUF442 family)